MELIGEDNTRSIQNIFANASFLNNQLTEIYKKENNASKFLNQDVNGLSHMDEMALQVIEKGKEIIKNYKV